MLILAFNSCCDVEMRVLFVTSSYYPIVGGSEVLTRILSTKLNDIGICADIMTFNMDKKWNPLWREDTVKDGLVSVFKEPALNPLPSLPNPLFNLFRVNVIPKPNFTRRFKDYDILHFVGEADLSFPLFSCFIKKPKLLQCVGIFRRGGIYRYYMSDRVFLGKIFKRLFPSLADKFVISSDEEKTLLSEMGIPEDKILILPIGVDTDVFRNDETKRTDNLVLFVGRIDRIKGLHILLKALSYLKTPVRLAVVGPRWDEKYAKQIEEMSHAINESGTHKVMFLGELNQKELVPWYQKASLLACPYLYETYSNVIRESLACGTPVVSTGTHLYEQGSDGVVLAPKDPKRLAEAVESLIKDKEMRKKCGEEGRRVVERFFSWESILKDLSEIYESMATGKSHPARTFPVAEPNASYGR
jgi:glycosyltransferase involved in cell wall biosynthesis